MAKLKNITPEIIEDLKTLNYSQFCAKYNVSPPTYYQWKKKYYLSSEATGIQETEISPEIMKGKITEIPELPEKNPAILELDNIQTPEGEQKEEKGLIFFITKNIYSVIFLIIEKIFRMRYKGKIEDFAKKVAPLWEKFLQKYGMQMTSFSDYMLFIIHLELLFSFEKIEEKKESTGNKIEKEIKIEPQTPTSFYNIDDYLDFHSEVKILEK